MPVFRKGRITPAQERLLEKKIVRAKGKKRKFWKREKWGAERTFFERLKLLFPSIFRPFIGENFIDRRFRETGRQQVVLDWGCAKGRTIGELASELGDKVHAYGFSRDSYRQWKDVDGVKFIHSTKEDLLRYLKDGSVDLTFSFSAIENLFEIELNSKSRKGISYIQKLVPKLAKGGRIVFEPFTYTGPKVIDAIRRALDGKAEVEFSGRVLTITKI